MAMIPIAKPKPNFHSTAGNPRIAIAKRNPAVQAPVTTPTTQTPAVSTPTTMQPASDPNGTFKSTYDFVPKDYAADPIYNWQKTEGLDSLAKLNSSRGLTGSGAELENNRKFLTELAAREGDRGLTQASTDAGRYDTYAQNNANRQYMQGNDQWSRIMDILNYQQKNSPFNQAVAGLNQYGTLGMDQGKYDASVLASLFKKVGSSGGGGVGPFIPPQPSGPDHTMSNLYAASSGQQNNQGYASDILSGLASLFK